MCDSQNPVCKPARRLSALLLGLLICCAMPQSWAADPTPAQIQQMLDSLSPTERAVLLEKLTQEQSTGRTVPLESPEVVRKIDQPPRESGSEDERQFDERDQQSSERDLERDERDRQGDERDLGRDDRDRQGDERDLRRDDRSRQGDERDLGRDDRSRQGDERDLGRDDRSRQGDERDLKRDEKRRQPGKSDKSSLRPFGYDLFAGVPSTFAPATDIPVPADYVIGPGDTIQLQLFGKENLSHELVVDREGMIQLPTIGPKSVAGLSFAELKRNLETWIKEQMIGVQIAVSMGPLRSIRVFVLGDAAYPGSYTVSGLSTMTHALFVSGGVKRIGSLRNIELKRGGKLVTQLDLYDLLLNGDTSHDQRLQPGDVIFVPPVGTTVDILGEVRRPARYELKHSRGVEELIQLAGGALPTATLELVQIERISSEGRTDLIDIDATVPKGQRFQLRDGDAVTLPKVLDVTKSYVKLRGHVERAGTYQWREQMRLTDLLTNLEALRDQSDLDYLLVQRRLPPDDRLEVRSVRIGRAIADPSSSDNLLLRPKDELIVFDREQNRARLLAPLVKELRSQARNGNLERVVSVGGSVKFPGEYPLEADMTVAGLVRAAGGLSQAAYTLDVELVRYQVSNGNKQEIERRELDLQGILGGTVPSEKLQSFDSLLVRQIPDWQERQTVELKGEVKFPGKFVVKKGETLTQVLKRAGGVTDRGYPQGSLLLRRDLQKKEQQQIDKLLQQLKNDLANLTLEKAKENQQATLMTQGLVEQLSSARAAGRLVIDLPAILNGQAADVVIQDGDKLFIPMTPQEVTVLGEVNFPTSHLFDPELDRDDYINRSGGLNSKADEKRIYVIHANGEVVASSGSRWFGSGKQRIALGDTVVVPLDVERMRPLTLWTSVTQVVYQLALSAAAFKSVGAL